MHWKILFFWDIYHGVISEALRYICEQNGERDGMYPGRHTHLHLYGSKVEKTGHCLLHCGRQPMIIRYLQSCLTDLQCNKIDLLTVTGNVRWTVITDGGKIRYVALIANTYTFVHIKIRVLWTSFIAFRPTAVRTWHHAIQTVAFTFAYVEIGVQTTLFLTRRPTTPLELKNDEWWRIPPKSLFGTHIVWVDHSCCTNASTRFYIENRIRQTLFVTSWLTSLK